VTKVHNTVDALHTAVDWCFDTLYTGMYIGYMESVVVSAAAASPLLVCCMVVCTQVLECVQLYAKLSRLNHIARHATSTYGQSMTNGAYYIGVQIHHSSWYRDIRTSNRLNTPPEWLSRPFQMKQSTKEKRSQSNLVDLLKSNVPN
jgi:hypothetical protein